MRGELEDGRAWLRLRGSYEEAVLSWQERIEVSFRRRSLRDQRGRTRQEEHTQVELTGERSVPVAED